MGLQQHDLVLETAVPLRYTLLPSLASFIDLFRLARQSDVEFDVEFNPLLVEYCRLSADRTLSQLQSLHQLTQDGALTQEEFEREKLKLFGHDAPTMASRIQMEAMPIVGEILKQATGRIAEHAIAELLQSVRKANQKKRK